MSDQFSKSEGIITIYFSHVSTIEYAFSRPWTHECHNFLVWHFFFLAVGLGLVVRTFMDWAAAFFSRSPKRFPIVAVVSFQQQNIPRENQGAWGVSGWEVHRDRIRSHWRVDQSSIVLGVKLLGIFETICDWFCWNCPLGRVRRLCWHLTGCAQVDVLSDSPAVCI